MADWALAGGRLRGGIWQGLLRGGPGAPKVELLHGKVVIQGLSVSPQGADWALRVPVPSEFISDGVQTFLLRDTTADTILGHFTIIAGVPMEDDIRAELDLLRAELDMLKRAFRRHCLETQG